MSNKRFHFHCIIIIFIVSTIVQSKFECYSLTIIYNSWKWIVENRYTISHEYSNIAKTYKRMFRWHKKKDEEKRVWEMEKTHNKIALIAFTFMTTILLAFYHQLMSIKRIKCLLILGSYLEFYFHCYCIINAHHRSNDERNTKKNTLHACVYTTLDKSP